MATDLERLIVQLEASLTKFERSMQRAQGISNKTAKGVEDRFALMNKKIDGFFLAQGKNLLRLGGAFSTLAIGREIFTQFLSFDEAMTRINTLVGVSRDQTNAWKEDLLQLAGDVGKGPTELAQGLYFVTSSGTETSKALEVLKASAQAAELGLGDVATVADAATNLTNAYAKANLSGAQAVAILAAGVKFGKTEADAFAPALGQVIPIASKLGVTADQVTAALAAMSLTGTNASEAATQLNAIFSALIQGGSQFDQSLIRHGSSLEEMRRVLAEDGLLAVLQKLTGVYKGNDAALAAAIGNIRAIRGVFNLMGENANKTREIFEALAKVTGVDLSNAFNSLADEPAHKLNQAMARLQAAAVIIGEQIIPAIADGLETIAQWLPIIARTFAVIDDLTTFDFFDYKNELAELKSDWEQLGNAVKHMREEQDRVSALRNRNFSPIPQGFFDKPPTKIKAEYAPTPVGFNEDQQKFIDGKLREVDALKQEAAAINLTAREAAAAKFEFDALQSLQESGLEITPALAAKIKELAAAYGEATEAANKLKEAQDLIKDVAGGFIRDMAHAFKDGKTAVDALADSLDNIADKLIDLAANRIIQSFLQSSAGGSLTTSLASILHEGGIVGQGGRREAVSPLLFAGAPRLHRGLTAGEYPAILKAGEEVLTPAQSRARRGGINVQIVQNAPVRVRAERNDGAGPDLKIVVDEMQSENIANPRAASHKTLRNNFGLRPALTRA